MSEKNLKVCPSCNVDLKSKSDGYAMGSPLARNRFHTDIYSCPKCGRIFLFESERDVMVTCPVCGTQHYKNEPCITCALNKGIDAEAGN